MEGRLPGSLSQYVVNNIWVLSSFHVVDSGSNIILVEKLIYLTELKNKNLIFIQN